MTRQTITADQADALRALAYRKGLRRWRGRGGVLDWLSIGDSRLDTEISVEQWQWAMDWLSRRDDAKESNG